MKGDDDDNNTDSESESDAPLPSPPPAPAVDEWNDWLESKGCFMIGSVIYKASGSWADWQNGEAALGKIARFLANTTAELNALFGSRVCTNHRCK